MFARLKRWIAPLAAPLAAVLALGACDGLPTGPARAVDPNQPVTVALLVPLGSGNAVTDQLGQSLVNAARLAQADLSNVNIDLRVYETGGSGDMATVAATRAVAEGAQIILGPLFSPATTAAAQVAAGAGLNVISFSNNVAVAGGNVYILGTTFESVADRLVGQAVGQGMNRFAIVHQDGLEGEAGRAAVSAAIARNGGNLVATANYALSIEQMSDRAAEIATTLNGSGANVVFFTDSPLQGLGFMTASLATRNYRGGSDAQFLGLTRWDSSPEVLGAPSLTGGWFAVPDPALTLEFETRYQLAYGTEAHNLSALAYDAVAAVGAMISSARAAGEGNAFSIARITNDAGFAGVNGVFRFRANGTNQRLLAVMEVGEGVANEISPAPRSFAGSGI